MGRHRRIKLRINKRRCRRLPRMTCYSRILPIVIPDNRSIVTKTQSRSPLSTETEEATITIDEKIDTVATREIPVTAWPIPSESDGCIQKLGPTRSAKASVETSKAHPNFAGQLRPRSPFTITIPVDCPPRELGIIDFRVPIFSIATSKNTQPNQRGRASITGWWLELRKSMQTGRLIGIAVSRLFCCLILLGN